MYSRKFLELFSGATVFLSAPVLPCPGVSKFWGATWTWAVASALGVLLIERAQCEPRDSGLL
jgi:hypothetical protein